MDFFLPLFCYNCTSFKYLTIADTVPMGVANLVGICIPYPNGIEGIPPPQWQPKDKEGLLHQKPHASQLAQ